MRALGAEGLHLSACIDEKDLCIEAFDFNFLLGSWLEVERGNALELVILGHGSCR